MTKRHAHFLLLSACALLVTTYIGGLHLRGYYDGPTRMIDIAQRTTHAPYAYRVLVPYTMYVAAQAVATPTAANVIVIEKLIGSLALTGWLIGMYVWLRYWLGRTMTLLAVYAAAFSFVVVVQDWPQVMTLVEAALYVWALLWLRGWYDGQRRDFGTFLLITIAASLNRSTGLFIPLFLLAVGWASKRRDGIRVGGIGTAISVVIYVGLRLIIGTRSRWSVFEIAAFNVQVIEQSALYLLVMFGGWWGAMFSGARKRDPFRDGLLTVCLLYVAFLAVFGVWREVRLLMPVYPILFMLATTEMGGDRERVVAQ